MEGRKYHVVAIRETHGSDVYPKGHKTRLTAFPTTHTAACTILRKQVPHKHLRYMVEEVKA